MSSEEIEGQLSGGTGSTILPRYLWGRNNLRLKNPTGLRKNWPRWTKVPAPSSGQASGVNLATYTRGAWKGSDVKEAEIDWLYRSRRIPEGVSYRIPGKELEPTPEPAPASPPSRNTVFYLSCYVSFMEAFIGHLPTIDTFARFYNLRINSIQDKKLPNPKPPVQCGACIITPRQASHFYRFSGLESCRTWQQTFFYVKNTDAVDLINLPAYAPGAPSRANWRFNPKETHVETNRIIRFMRDLNKNSGICSDDIIRAFVSRRVLPLQCRVHKIGQMGGRRDPTRITSFGLSKSDVVLKAKKICQTEMLADWPWGLQPLSRNRSPSSEAVDRFPRILEEVPESFTGKRHLDKEDPDPYVVGNKNKMGPTHSRRPGNPPVQNPNIASDTDDDIVVLEVYLLRESGLFAE
ncbi:hypothetical protein QYE76_023798 [Lolium multiflorum]|uniref:Uncharacterized protein n=1 Tax=Lolium multiflorum TaxID=4521 RepID=A0AAD8RCW4_LOLMU|nr:hypothetical protein QYE76_023798 [Lolium multiflorum]